MRRLILLNGSNSPNNNISDIEIYEFNDPTEDFVTWPQCDEAMEKHPQLAGMRRIQHLKIIQLDLNRFGI